MEGIEDVKVEEHSMERETKMSKNVTFRTDLKLDANDNHSHFKFSFVTFRLGKFEVL